MGREPSENVKTENMIDREKSEHTQKAIAIILFIRIEGAKAHLDFDVKVNNTLSSFFPGLHISYSLVNAERIYVFLCCIQSRK